METTETNDSAKGVLDEHSIEPLRNSTNVFSFKGRIGRGEYALYLVAYFVVNLFFNNSTDDSPNIALIKLLVLLLLLWVLIAAGVKRCHDLGKSGWWILVPFYGFVLLFATGEPSANEYDALSGVDEVEADFDQETQAQIDQLMLEWDALETTDERRLAINAEIESFEPTSL